MLRWLSALVGALLLAGAGYIVVTSSPERGHPLGQLSPSRRSDQATATRGLLAALQAALARGDSAAVSETAATDGGGPRRELIGIAANARRLRLGSLELRYVGPSGLQLSQRQRTRYGSQAWVSDVRLTWRFRGVDPAPSTVEVPVVLTWSADEARFVTARAALENGSGRRLPLWLVERLVVRRTPDTLVLAGERGRANRLVRQAVPAVTAIRGRLPRWRRPLVLEAPDSVAGFRAAAGLREGAEANIAAVTTTAGTSGSDPAAAHVYINPAVFERLGPHGQRIVLRHEAAHVALGASTTRVPMWLVEGVADYLALADTRIAVSDLAAQILEKVRQEGAPVRLPGASKFEAGNADIGAWYEAAWLAARLLAEQHGEAALLELYRVADREGETARAFRRVLGTTERQFTRQWRSYLSALAG